MSLPKCRLYQGYFCFWSLGKMSLRQALRLELITFAENLTMPSFLQADFSSPDPFLATDFGSKIATGFIKRVTSLSFRSDSSLTRFTVRKKIQGSCKTRQLSSAEFVSGLAVDLSAHSAPIASCVWKDPVLFRNWSNRFLNPIWSSRNFSLLPISFFEKKIDAIDETESFRVRTSSRILPLSSFLSFPLSICHSLSSQYSFLSLCVSLSLFLSLFHSQCISLPRSMYL